VEDRPASARRLSYEETQSGLRKVIIEGMASQTMEALTKGVFLIGFAIELGASNFVVGLLGAVPFLSNLFQIPAVHMVEKYRNRKKIVAMSCFIGRAFLLVVAIVPFVEDKRIALMILTMSIATRYCVGAMAGCAWNSWMRDLVPKVILSKFFSKRLFYTTTASAFVGLSAGFFLDWWDGSSAHPLYGYSVLYFCGFVAAMVSSTMILSIPHPAMQEPEVKQYHNKFTLRYLKEPLEHANFRKFVGFLMSWNFAINLASPFFAVYMIKTLHYDMFFVVSITLMGQLINAFTLNVWGRYSDKYSNKTVLGVCGTLFIFSILGWTLTTLPEKHEYTTAILIGLHIVMGVSMSGVNLTTASLAMKLTPSKKATSFLAVNTILSSFAAGVAPLFGGFFADFFEDKMLNLDFHWHNTAGETFVNTLVIGHWDFFFILAFILGLYSLRRLALIEEDGSVHEKVVIREIMLDTGKVLRSLSTIDGLRELTMAPMAMMINIVKKDNKRPMIFVKKVKVENGSGDAIPAER
jgi:MFS family permease